MSPSKRAIVLRRRARLEDAAAREQLRLLRQLRRDILRAVVEAQGFRSWHLQQMLAVVEAEIVRLQPDAGRAMATVTRTAWRYGIEIVDLSLAGTATSGLGLYGISPSLLNAVVDVTTDQVRRIWSELGSGLKLQVRRVTLGVEDPFEAIGRVARLIRDPKTFGTALNRAEAIVRTEVNRTFSTATQDRMEQGDKRLKVAGERLMKWWLTAEDARVRPDHVAAGERYSRKKPIPIDEPFMVGGEALMFPRDPAASARQTVNCRCVHLSVVVTEEEFKTLKKAA